MKIGYERWLAVLAGLGALHCEQQTKPEAEPASQTAEPASDDVGQEPAKDKGSSDTQDKGDIQEKAAATPSAEEKQVVAKKAEGDVSAKEVPGAAVPEKGKGKDGKGEKAMSCAPGACGNSM